MQHLNSLFAEGNNIVMGAVADMAGASGLATPWVSLRGYLKATLVFMKAVGNAAEDPVITLQQATAVAGTGAKALASITRADRKTGADPTVIGLFTAVTQAAASTYTAEGGEGAVHCIDVRPEDLDKANNFDCVRATIADTGATATFGVLFWILHGPRYAGAGMINPLTD